MRHLLVILSVMYQTTNLTGQDSEPLLVDPKYDVNLILPETVSGFNGIKSICFDSLGYLWFCSYEGLHCYDGNKIISYNNDHKPGHIQVGTQGSGYNEILTSDGRYLWIQEHVSWNWCCFDTRERQIVMRISIDYTRIMTYECAVKDQGIYQVRMNREDFSDAQFWQLSPDSISPVVYHPPAQILDYRVVGDTHLLRTSEEIIALSSKNRELYSVPATTVQFSRSISSGSIDLFDISETRGLTIDAKSQTLKEAFETPALFTDHLYFVHRFGSQVWFIDEQSGIFLWDQESNTIQDYSDILADIVSAQSPASLSAPLYSGILRPDGSFIFHSINLICIFTPKHVDASVFHKPIDSGNPITSVRAIVEDGDHNIYVAYYTGIAFMESGSERFSDFRGTRDAHKAKESTYSLTLWNDQLIWDNAIIDLKRDHVDFIGMPQMYGQALTHYLTEDTLWYFRFGSNVWGRYHLQSKEHVILNDELLTEGLEFVSAIVRDPRTQQFWLATSHQGIALVSASGKVIRAYTAEDLMLGQPHRSVYEMHLRGDTLWYGSQRGLGMLDIQTGEVQYFHNPFTIRGGRTQQRWIYAIHPEDDGHFLLGTNHGICHFNTSTYKFRNLANDQPLADKEFNRNSHFHASDGTYYFGTVDGLYAFAGEDLVFGDDVTPSSPPLIYLITIRDPSERATRILDKNLEHLGILRLSSTESNVRFYMTSPAISQKTYFSYRIEGLSDIWSAYRSDGELEIPAFPPGEYRMEIRASVFPQSDSFTTTDLLIIRPQVWYKRWYAIIAYAIALIGFVAVLLHWRFIQQMRRRAELEQLRVKISSDLHDDVGGILSGLAMQSELMTYEVHDDKQKASLGEISRMSRDAMERMRDTVWAIDSRKDKYSNLIDRMRTYAEQSLDRRSIASAFRTSGIDLSAFIHPEVRQNLYLIFKEAITNVVRHSDATEVQIDFHKNGSKTRLVVHDNGSARTNASGSDGQGLMNMRMRAEKISGSFHAGYDNGWKVELSVWTNSCDLATQVF